MLTGVLVIVAFLITAYLLFSGWLDLRLARSLERVVASEKTRGVWAEARAKLLDLVVEGKLDPRSDTFRTFYGLHTFVMRRPDAFDAFSLQLAKAMIYRPKRKRESWAQEQAEWPREMAEVVERMAFGTQMLVFGHSPGRRYLARFVIRVAPWLAMHASMRWTRAAWHWLKRQRVVKVERRMLQAYSRIEALQHALTASAVSESLVPPMPTPA